MWNVYEAFDILLTIKMKFHSFISFIEKMKFVNEEDYFLSI